MAYNYLELVNEICRKVNEVPLTSLTFTTSSGMYGVIKDGINRAIQDINNKEDFWRFNFAERVQLLQPGQSRIYFPTNSKVVDFDSFRIGSNVETTLSGASDWTDSLVWSDAGNYTDLAQFVFDKELSFDNIFLETMDYDLYLQKYSKDEFNPTKRNTPRWVAKTPDSRFNITPAPDVETMVVFDYYVNTTPMVLHSDVPRIPERYKYVIFTGAMRDVAVFREDEFNTERYEFQFTEQVKSMRIREINLYHSVRSGMIYK